MDRKLDCATHNDAMRKLCARAFHNGRSMFAPKKRDRPIRVDSSRCRLRRFEHESDRVVWSIANR